MITISICLHCVSYNKQSKADWCTQEPVHRQYFCIVMEHNGVWGTVVLESNSYKLEVECLNTKKSFNNEHFNNLYPLRNILIINTIVSGYTQ